MQGLDPLLDGAEGATISTIGFFIGKWSGFVREGEARRRGGGRRWLRGHEEEADPDPDPDEIEFHPQHMQDTAKLAAKKLAFLILLLILLLSLCFILLLSRFLTALLIHQEAAG